MMKNLIQQTVYFQRSGQENTDETLKLAQARSKKLGITSVIIASTTGTTGVKAARVFKDANLVVVTHTTGFREPNLQDIRPENRLAIERNGGQLLTTAHAFGTLGRAVRRKFGAIQMEEIVANVLRLFGEGVKVACEITCMASDAGLIRTDEEVIGIGGSGRGADTALVLKPSNTHTFFDMRIKEIICKPRL
jgi:hypothetical protein